MAIAALEHRSVRLDNGLLVVLVPRRATPLVTVWVRYDVGSADDPPDQRGLAHLVEHLLFTGSKHTYGDDASDHLYRARALGANGATSMRTTDYYATVPRENLERLLWLESDRMGFMRGEVTRTELKLARQVVGTELRIGENDPHARMFGRVHNAVFAAPHPYFDPEDASALVGVEVATVEAFINAYVVPANARVVIAGDLPDDVEGLVGRYFGDLAGGVKPVRAVVPPSALRREVRIREVAGHPLLKIGWVSGAHLSGGDAAADVAAVLLEHNAGGLLWPDDGAVARLTAQQVSRAGSSVFVVQAVGRVGVRAEDMLGVVDEAMRRLGELGGREIAAARAMLRVEGMARRDSLMAVAELVQSHLGAYGRADALEEALARYDAVDAAGLAGCVGAARAVLLAEPGGAR